MLKQNAQSALDCLDIDEHTTLVNILVRLSLADNYSLEMNKKDIEELKEWVLESIDYDLQDLSAKFWCHISMILADDIEWYYTERIYIPLSKVSVKRSKRGDIVAVLTNASGTAYTQYCVGSHWIYNHERATITAFEKFGDRVQISIKSNKWLFEVVARD